MNRNILIFGSGGFVGSYLAEEFTSHGYRVYGTDIVEPKSSRQFFHDYTSLDMLSFDGVLRLMERSAPDYVVNLAAVSSVGDSWRIPQKTIEVNINGTLNILEAVRKSGIKARILLIGSSEEYAPSAYPISESYPVNASNPYGISKVAQENFAGIYRSSFGMDIISTRTFNHTGIGQPEKFVIPSFVRQAVEIERSGGNGKIYVGNLSAKRDFGDVRDMVSAYRMILESNTSERVFNVGRGICYSLEEILKYIASLVHGKVEVIVSPEKFRPVENPVIWCDNSRLRSATGWSPKYDVFDAIRGMFGSMASGR